MQHIRTPGVAVSHIRNILDLIASIRSQVRVSCGLLILITYARQIPFDVPHSPKRLPKNSIRIQNIDIIDGSQTLYSR
jgi:hypothetical protein